MTDADRADLVARGVGITNLVRRATARASELSREELREGGERLLGFVAGKYAAYLFSFGSLHQSGMFWLTVVVAQSRPFESIIGLWGSETPACTTSSPQKFDGFGIVRGNLDRMVFPSSRVGMGISPAEFSFGSRKINLPCAASTA